MVNTIAAYTFTSRHYNGEPEHSAKESGSCLMQLSDNLNHNANFSEADLAVQAVVLNAVNVSGAANTKLQFSLSIALTYREPIR
jgi:hypothetical protein